uniref:PDZ domain-containing protein n=1 Tax=Bursaphelenchus xylophilus TaxID=6326 RepID=A0A1I7S4Z0_BURXY
MVRFLPLDQVPLLLRSLQPIKNFQEMHKLCKGKISLKLCRDEYCTVQATSLPDPKPGFQAFDFDIKWREGGMPIGILVCTDSEKQVMVSMIENGSLASSSLRPGDILVKVNDTAISDRNVAKKLILDSVTASNRVKLTVHRQIERDVPSLIHSTVASPGNPPNDLRSSKDTQSEKSQKSEVKSITATAKPARPKPKGLPNFDTLVPPDVLAIMEANKDFWKKPNSNPPILKSRSAPGPRINLEGQVEETQIAYEPGPKPLRNTPKRVGS